MTDIRMSQMTGIPYGDNADRPINPISGQPYFNGEEQRLELYNGNDWTNIIQEAPSVTSISGTYKESELTNVITIYGTNFSDGALAYAIGNNGVEINANSTTFNSVVQLTASFSGLTAALEPYDIKVVNTSNLFGILPDTLYVDEIPSWVTPTSLPAFTKDIAYSTTLSATDSGDSGSTISYSVVSGLPSGLSLSSGGVLSGTVSSSTAISNFVVRATDNNGNYIDRTFSIPNVGPVWVTSGTISGYLNFALSQQLIATDDSGLTLSYALESGSLPPGINLSSSGLISGTPTIAGAYSFKVNATDSNGTTATSSTISMPILNFPSTDVLVVGGGASGATNGTSGAGGGGGGQVISNSSLTFDSVLNVTVGAGGSALSIVTSSTATGNNGNNSVFHTITASGGFGGTNSGGASGNGNSGGNYTSCPGDNVAGGGGGNGGPGQAGSCANPSTGSYNGTGIAGAGGPGSAYSTTGVSVAYGGGGGGGCQSAGANYTPPRGGPGGTGGGGYGGGDGNLSFGLATLKAQDGTANLGGGGGGSNNTYMYLSQEAYGNSGAGGSGVVILAIQSTYTNTPTISPGLVYAYSASERSGYRVWKFTAGTGTFTV